MNEQASAAVGGRGHRKVAPTRTSPQAREYVELGYWQGELLDQALLGAAAREPDRLAIVDRDRMLAFGELASRIERLAAALAGLGVGPGEVVSFQLPNWLEASLVHHAVVRLGAVSNPIIPIYRERELSFILRQAGTSVFVVPDVWRGVDHRAMVEEIRGDLPDLEHVLVVGEPAPGMRAFEEVLESGGRAPEVARDAGDAVLLLYTSGTESNPKGVIHSHDTLAFECRSMIDLLALTPDDVVLMPSPVTHITGLLYGLQLPLMLGTAVVLQDVWNVDVALELIERHGCTLTIGATPFLYGFVNAAQGSERDVSSLRVFGCGGADVPPALVRSAHELGVSATRLYGSTECPTVTGTPFGEAIDRHSETDGKPFPGSELRLVDDDGAEVPVGSRGNLEVRGPDLCLGYLDAEINARSFTAEGWFKTGDLGVLDEQGYLRIAGRVKDVINRGGENLSAKEIEDLLFEHPEVEEVAVVAFPDEMLGERACAYVVGPAQLTLEDLVSFLRERKVAKQKLPEKLRVVPELPKTASGKVQKYVLRERIAAEVAAETSA